MQCNATLVGWVERCNDAMKAILKRDQPKVLLRLAGGRKLASAKARQAVTPRTPGILANSLCHGLDVPPPKAFSSCKGLCHLLAKPSGPVRMCWAWLGLATSYYLVERENHRILPKTVGRGMLAIWQKHDCKLPETNEAQALESSALCARPFPKWQTNAKETKETGTFNASNTRGCNCKREPATSLSSGGRA
jgi:hypothetical protein